ncbi:MAG TPA: hypothetical protein VGQ65_06920 [Thermoanaerobaculia bacterium]|jgi:hypothetical protein|nr:hypothetical protein [Thermoanaerobaculia bacterium]
MRRRLARPEAERRNRGKVLEIPVYTQQDEFVPDAEPGQESINGSDLNAATATVVAKICCCGVIFALGHDQRQRSESIKNLLSRFRAAETLQDLLKNQACSEDRSFVPKSVSQEVHAGMTLTAIAAHGKRPDTGVNEQFQSRDRAVL